MKPTSETASKIAVEAILSHASAFLGPKGTPFATRKGGGRKAEWTLRPESHDNHWLDCTVGCAVAASMLGETLPCANLSREKKPKRVLKLSSVQKRKEMGL